MAEIPNNDPVPGAAEVEAAAERELGQALQEFKEGLAAPEAQQTEAAPQPASTPTVPPDGTNAQEAPKVEGQPPAGPAEAGTLEESPAFQKALEIYGGDHEAAAKGFLETNTRNAQIAARLRELGIDPKTLQPYPQPVEQTPPVAQPLNEKAVQGEVNRLLDADPNFGRLVQAYSQNDGELRSLVEKVGKIEDEIRTATLALSIPEIKADSFKADQYEAQIARKQTELLQLQLKQSLLEGKQEALGRKANELAAAARQTTLQTYQEYIRTQQEEVELNNYYHQERAKFETSWPIAIEKAIKDFKVPPEEVEDFKEDVRLAGLAHLARTDEGDPKSIPDPFRFAAERAKVLMDRLDRYHRTRSAEYGKQAATRSAVVGAGVPVPQAQPAAGSPQPLSMADAERALEADARAAWDIFLRPTP
jgi:hypothetical protein